MPTRISATDSAHRRAQLRALLERSKGLSVEDVTRHFGVITSTAWRWLEDSANVDETLVKERRGHRVVYHLERTHKPEALSPTVLEVIALVVARAQATMLAGTSMGDALDSFVERILASAGPKHGLVLRSLERKFFDANVAPVVLEQLDDTLNELASAIVREQRVRLRVEKPQRGRRVIEFDPYTLMTHEQMLYVIGYSHAHGMARMFGLDVIKSAEWLRGHGFHYPESFHPGQHLEGALGIIKGPEIAVRLRFDASAVRYVMRRKWRPEMTVNPLPDSRLELRMRAAHTIELTRWILGWGEQIEVLEPPELRAEVAEIARRIAKRHVHDAK